MTSDQRGQSTSAFRSDEHDETIVIPDENSAVSLFLMGFTVALLALLVVLVALSVD